MGFHFFSIAAFFILLFIQTSSAQSISINNDGSNANSSSILDVKSNTKGILVPRMTKAEKFAILSPASGLLVYQNVPDSIGFHFFDGIKWNWILGSGNVDTSKWEITGNNIRNKNTGNVGINTGTVTPTSNLEVNGSIAIGVQLGVVGGPFATPINLLNNKSYIGLMPAANLDCYELPIASTCVGRIYFIRNNLNNGIIARIRAQSPSLICPGNSNCLSLGDYYDLQNSSSVKTIMCISDGQNWTVGKVE